MWRCRGLMSVSNDEIVREAELLELTTKLKNEVSDIFKELRFESGWTQRQAAEAIGTSQQNLPRLENYTLDLKLSTLVKFAYGYGYKVQISFVPLGEEDV